MSQEKYDIFISYSRKDTAIADQICAALDSVGITYFIDRQGIGGGFEFPAVLAENIVNSKIFLLLASKNSYESKFTRSEIIFAFNKKPKNAILPYIIDKSSLPIDLEFVFARINWRTIKEHPIDPVLVDDLLNLLGRKRELKWILKEDEVKTYNSKMSLSTFNSKSIMVFVAVAIVCIMGYWGVFSIRMSKNNSIPEEKFIPFENTSGQYGYKFESTNEILIPCKYGKADRFKKGLARVELDDQWGYIDKTGKEVISLKYDYIDEFSEELARVVLNHKCGFVDKNGKEVIPLIYDGAGSFNGNLVNVRLNGKWGYIDKLGKEIIALKYDHAYSFQQGWTCVKLNGKWGFIDKYDKEIIPFIYDDVTMLGISEAHVRFSDEWFNIDRNGNIVK